MDSGKTFSLIHPFESPIQTFFTPHTLCIQTYEVYENVCTLYTVKKLTHLPYIYLQIQSIMWRSSVYFSHYNIFIGYTPRNFWWYDDIILNSKFQTSNHRLPLLTYSKVEFPNILLFLVIDMPSSLFWLCKLHKNP